MTSLAFFFGVLPLAVATGAGAGAMKAIGTAVAGGMLTATVIAIFFIPLFFVLISRIFKRKQKPRDLDNGSDATPSAGDQSKPVTLSEE
jgi:Cu/Ag efflux pump CusA